MSAWMVRQKLLIQINTRNPGFPSTFSEKKTLRDHPPKAGKYVQRLSIKLDPRSYFLHVYDESSKKEFQTDNLAVWPGWCDFVLQAIKLTEVVSRTIVLVILRSLCIFSFNWTQQLCETYLMPKFKPLEISPQRQTAPKSKPQHFRVYIDIKSLTDI